MGSRSGGGLTPIAGRTVTLNHNEPVCAGSARRFLAKRIACGYPPPLDRPPSAPALRFPRVVHATAVGPLLLGVDRQPT